MSPSSAGAPGSFSASTPAAHSSSSAATGALGCGGRRAYAARAMASLFDVVCFGEALWDLYEKRSGVYVRRVGGAMANVAAWLAREGASTSLVASLGKDALGDAL